MFCFSQIFQSSLLHKAKKSGKINNYGAMAHLGARQTEDLEVAGSSPACPIPFFLN
ncbi:hypothetical protein BDQ94DRAFT_133521 [Aspergillus welwitschiae]|uniref:Uncharacterized protein n=1 Tax=Aspergillus welwitschiae TaxID=1341132 RepID=A0A3F3QK33_9EURO|nr:hypothetical protein BDQ94DRAFT_133521 [Aspergillus welwitschiae]RDH39704.1 hypothetical protein BDQ94DRAFT_133521 [Aspergillus welwitschiae]